MLFHDSPSNTWGMYPSRSLPLPQSGSRPRPPASNRASRPPRSRRPRSSRKRDRSNGDDYRRRDLRNEPPTPPAESAGSAPSRPATPARRTPPVEKRFQSRVRTSPATSSAVECGRRASTLSTATRWAVTCSPLRRKNSAGSHDMPGNLMPILDSVKEWTRCQISRPGPSTRIVSAILKVRLVPLPTR